MKLQLNLKSETNLWSEWWRTQSSTQKLIPLLIGLSYILFNFLFHILRSDHFGIVLLVFVLWYAGPRVRPFLRFLLPLILVGVVYDSQRIYGDYIRGPIHVREPYDFDKYFFGINTPEGRLTPNEWWQKHTYPVLDLYCGFFYLTFISIYVATCAYFCFWLPKKGTAKHEPAWFQNQAFRPMWAFFWVNCLGYSTYYWFAAAPPWYVAQYGLGPANLSVAASAAGALRFYALLGTHFFTGMYGRAADVFGAVPSLHVAYPLQAVYYSFRYGAARTFAILFYLSMCFSAVYLNHHYLLDILWGSGYAILICLILDQVAKQKLKTP